MGVYLDSLANDKKPSGKVIDTDSVHLDTVAVLRISDEHEERQEAGTVSRLLRRDEGDGLHHAGCNIDD